MIVPRRRERVLLTAGRFSLLAAAMVLVALEAPIASALIVTESMRTVQSRNFIVTWSSADQEAVQILRWHPGGAPASAVNVTASSNVGQCPAPFAPEYWGNSWAGGAPQNGEAVLVGLRTVTPPGERPWAASIDGTDIHSQTTDCTAPFVAAKIPTRTEYRFFDDALRANVIHVDRQFDFHVQPFGFAFRPYMPRLSRGLGLRFDEVRYPAMDGTLKSISVDVCPSGCVPTDWDAAQGWFAIHSPTTGRGVIVHRAANGIAPRLFVDWDGASVTNASSFLLTAPTEGFTAQVTERTALCFYDSTIWSTADQRDRHLPAGCVANETPTADAGADQAVSADAGCQSMVMLNAVGSKDPDDEVLAFTWAGPFGTANGLAPTVPLPLGTHSITVVVADPYGATASDTVVVTVRDTTAPVFGDVPAPVTLEQADPDGAALALAMPTVADNCSSVILTTDAPATFSPGTTTVTFTAHDTAGNTSKTTTMVTVVCCRVGLTVNKASASRGEWLTITTFVRNLSNTRQEVTLQLEFTSPMQSKLGTFPMTLLPGTNKSHTLPFKIPANAQPGMYTLKLTTVTAAGALKTLTTFEVLP